jgi:biopolymer transport protein ExbB/TolQ
VSLAVTGFSIHSEAEDVPELSADPAGTARHYNSQPTAQDSLSVKRLKAMVAYLGRREAIEANEMLSAEHERRFDEKISWPRFLSHSAVFLGLIGTLMGLYKSFQGLQGVLESAHIKEIADITKLIQQMGGLVGNMQNAFLCTLCGIVASVFTAFFIQLVHKHYLKKVLQPLDSYCSAVFAPFVSNSKDIELFSKAATDLSDAALIIDDNVKKQQGAMVAFLRGLKPMSEKIILSGDQFAQSLKESGDKIAETVSNSATEATDKTQKAANFFYGAVTQSATSFSGAVQENINSLNTTSTELSAATADLSKNHSKAVDEFGYLQIHISETFKPLRESIEALKAQTESIMSKLNQDVDSLTELTSKSLESLNEVSEAGKSAAEDSALRVELVFSEHLALTGDLLIAIKDKLQTTNEQINHLDGVLEDRIKSVGTTLSSSALGLLNDIVNIQNDHQVIMQEHGGNQVQQIETIAADLKRAIVKLDTLVLNADQAFRDAIQRPIQVMPQTRPETPSNQHAPAPQSNGNNGTPLPGKEFGLSDGQTKPRTFAPPQKTPVVVPPAAKPSVNQPVRKL